MHGVRRSSRHFIFEHRIDAKLGKGGDDETRNRFSEPLEERERDSIVGWSPTESKRFNRHMPDMKEGRKVARRMVLMRLLWDRDLF